MVCDKKKKPHNIRGWPLLLGLNPIEPQSDYPKGDAHKCPDYNKIQAEGRVPAH